MIFKKKFKNKLLKESCARASVLLIRQSPRSTNWPVAVFKKHHPKNQKKPRVVFVMMLFFLSTFKKTSFKLLVHWPIFVDFIHHTFEGGKVTLSKISN